MKYEYWLYSLLSLVIGFAVSNYYCGRLPDFDIGLSEAFFTLRCWLFVLLLWGVQLWGLRVLSRRTLRRRTFRLAAWLVVAAYGGLVWGYCYYQCVVRAMREWTQFINGDVG